MPLVYPGRSLHKELELLVESGLSPADALRAATGVEIRPLQQSPIENVFKVAFVRQFHKLLIRRKDLLSIARGTAC